ncbi:DUF2339 domain-containing protein [Salibacterium salarium]|uniref:DUF2339 domain-containing protein n=1 Tax=Salibacterium salarium TaxID=284579 RepID=UPI0027D9100B|nr:DUF2339 domain-containing protein [Salibacterium salarium]
MKEKLTQMKYEQKRLMEEFNAVVMEYESSNVLQENETLRKTNQDYLERLHDLGEKYSQMEHENQKLRYALHEQIIDEKTNILKLSKQKLNTYFSTELETKRDQLTELETSSKAEILKLKERVNHSIREDKQEITTKLEDLAAEVDETIRKERNLLAKEEQDLLHSFSSQYEQLGQEEVTEDVIQKRAKQNQIEMKIGLHWINKLGMLLIILGVAAAFRYSYTSWFNDYLKGGMFSLFGILMLFGGEWLYRKGRQTFALGLIGGGIAVLYGSIFFSYFLLEIIGLNAALLLSVLVTVTAVVLSLRYQSKTVCTFGLVGGYIPFYSYLFSFGLEDNAVYAAMAYLLILSGSILWITFQKQWIIIHYISYFLNIPSFFILVFLSPSSGVSLTYTIVTFLLYLMLTIGYPLTYKVSMKWADIVLLAFNTGISCSVIYFLFHTLDWNDYRGLLAVTFGLVYFALGRFVERRMPLEKQTMVLFYGTSIAFAVLIIPFQFGVEWLALGWLVESVVIMLYANRYKLSLLEKAGWSIFGLTVATFSLDVYRYINGFNPDFFHFKYFAIIAGLVLVMLYYVYDQTRTTRTNLFGGFAGFILGLKYFTLVNVWIYVVYEGAYLFSQNVASDFEHYWFYQFLVFSFLSVGLGYGLKKIPLLYDRTVKYFCLFLYGIGSFVGWIVTATMPALSGEQNAFTDYTALVVLIGFNILIYATGRDLLVAYIRGQYKNMELYPTILSVYFIAVLAAFLNVQFQLSDVGFVISLIFLVTAVAYILYGFKKNYVAVRRIGLGLSLFSTAKLCFVDLAFLTEGSKIIAYFCFGLVLLGISYMYQKVSSRKNNL